MRSFVWIRALCSEHMKRYIWREGCFQFGAPPLGTGSEVCKDTAISTFSLAVYLDENENENVTCVHVAITVGLIHRVECLRIEWPPESYDLRLKVLWIKSKSIQRRMREEHSLPGKGYSRARRFFISRRLSLLPSIPRTYNQPAQIAFCL